MEWKIYRSLTNHADAETEQEAERVAALLFDASVNQVRQILVDIAQLQPQAEQEADLFLQLWGFVRQIPGAAQCIPLQAAPLWAEKGQLFYGFLISQLQAVQAGLPAEQYVGRMRAEVEQVEAHKKAAYAFLPKTVPAWYRQNARIFPWRQDREPYHIWLSEIMLQQTRAAAVVPYYLRFLQELPTIADLAAAKEEKVLKLWEGLGYYSRARNLQRAAQVILREHGGVFPRGIKEIRALPGIGAYTAGAIAAICFNQPEPAVDGNVLRVLTRLMGDFRPIERPEVRREMESCLRSCYPLDDCNGFEQGLIELGATVCPPAGQPQCLCCPLQQVCSAQRQGVPMLLPRRLPKQRRRVEKKTVLLLQCGKNIAVRRRPYKGLLAGLWEFPNLDGHLNAQQALDAAQALGVQPVRLEQMLQRTHIFTHVEWQMQGFFIRCAAEAPGLEWAGADALGKQIALPSAFKIFLADALTEKPSKAAKTGEKLP